jgi:hypothetical protein
MNLSMESRLLQNKPMQNLCDPTRDDLRRGTTDD